MSKRSCSYQVQIGDQVKCFHSTCEHFEESVTKSICEGCSKRVDPKDFQTVQAQVQTDELPPTTDTETTYEIPESLAGKAGQAAGVIAGSFIKGRGNPLVDKETLKARRKACDNCPSRRDRTCTLCSCNIYAKSLFSMSRCPKAKWPFEAFEKWQKFYPKNWVWKLTNMKQRKTLVFGWGVNDAEYVVQPKVGPAQLRCPAYMCWHRMLTRCFSDVWLKQYPTYRNVEVSNEFKSFNNFRSWYFETLNRTCQTVTAELDKDILGGNVYSPTNCLLLPQHLNKFLYFPQGQELPTGVSLKKGKVSKPYVAQININGTSKHLGYFDTAEQAHQCWAGAKIGLLDTLDYPKWDSDTKTKFKKAVVRRIYDQ